jgi:hypothetical protein
MAKDEVADVAVAEDGQVASSVGEGGRTGTWWTKRFGNGESKRHHVALSKRRSQDCGSSSPWMETVALTGTPALPTGLRTIVH